MLRGAGQVEIEIEASARIVPQVNMITGPDRPYRSTLVNATPGAQLRNQVMNRKEVKSMRVGLFFVKSASHTRGVRLNGPQPYELFPSGKTVIVKIGRPGAEAVKIRSRCEHELISFSLIRLQRRRKPRNSRAACAPVPPKPRLVISFAMGCSRSTPIKPACQKFCSPSTSARTRDCNPPQERSRRRLWFEVVAPRPLQKFWRTC